MAHNIEKLADGTEAFFSARVPAWHTLGTVTEGCLTADQALEVAQLDWSVKVSENPVSTIVGEEVLTMPNKFITYRNHKKLGLAPLGVVGNKYVPIQNQDAFAFLTNLSDESGAIFETAGSLFNGREVFVSMRMPDSIKLHGDADTVDLYLMAYNSHDGSKALRVAVTPVRPVCTNTVALALREAKSVISISHTIGAQARVAQAREVLGLTFAYQNAFQVEVERMIDATYTDAQFEKLVAEIFPIVVGKTGEPSTIAITKANNKRDDLLALWTAPTQSFVANTKWAAYNAVAEYADWFAPVRGNDKDNKRAERIITGVGNELKEKALALLAW